MAQFADRVKVSNTTTASAGSATTLTLGSAEAGYQAVPSSLDGETIRYVIEEGNTWEIGTGTYTHSGTTLSRSVASSSNSNNAIAVTSSSKVFITPVVDDLQFVQVYSSTSDLPSASDNHGRITHVHGDGAMYFAHGGNWIKLANASDAISLTDLSVTQNAASGSGALTYNSTTGAFSYTPPASTSSSGGTLDPIKETETVVSAATQSAFNVAHAVDNIAVYLNGSRLSDADWNSNSGGTTVTLTTPAVQNDIVTVVEYGAPFAAPYSSAIYTVGSSSEINANRDVLTADYTQGKEAVYVNGVKYLSSTDYSTNTGGTAITFTPALSAGDIVELVEHGALADAASAFTDLTDTPSALGTAGQVVQVNSGGNALEFADASGGGVSVYTGLSGTDGTPSGAAYLLNASSPSNGDLAFVTGNNNVYVRAASGWRKIATIQEAPSAITGHNSSYEEIGQAATTDITLSATDPEGFDVAWSYVVGNGGTLSGSDINNSNGDTLASIAVQTANANSGGTNTITYRITRETTSISGSFSITFTATDSQASGTSDTGAISFSLSFEADWSGGGTLEGTLTTNVDTYTLPLVDGSGDRIALKSESSDTVDIFARSGTSWSLEKTFGTSETGTSPLSRFSAINDAGDFIRWDYSSGGSAYGARRSGTTWTRETIGSGPSTSDGTGCMSKNGNVVFLKARLSTTSVTRYVYSSGSWTSTSLTLPVAGVYSMATNSDGSELFVGDYSYNNDSGWVKRYTISGSTVTDEESIQGGDTGKLFSFGYSAINLSKNGLTLTVYQRYYGTVSGSNRQGKVFIYQRTSTSNNFGSPVTSYGSSTAGNNYLGEHTYISDDGYYVSFGTTLDQEVYVAEYDSSTSTWTKRTVNVPANEGGNKWVGLSGDAKRVAYLNSDGDAVYVYKSG